MVTNLMDIVTDIVTNMGTEQTITDVYTDWSANVTYLPTRAFRTVTEEVTSNDDYHQDSVRWVFDPPAISAFFFFQVIAAILGVVGNTCVLLVTSRWKAKMKSTTDALVRALAVADLLTSILIVPHPYASSVPNTILGEFYCKVVTSHIFMWTSVVASILTLTAISIERYLAISHPFFHRRSVTKKGIRGLIVTVWILAFLLNINPLFVEYVDKVSHHCVFRYHRRDLAGKMFYGVIVFVIEFITPSTIMVITHVLASRTLNRELLRFEKKTSQSETFGLSEKLVVAKKRNMNSLLIIFMTFLVCWAPEQIFVLLFNLGIIDHSHLESQAYSYAVLLAFVNSCANPIIYTIRYPKFRTAIASMLACCSGKHGKGKDDIPPAMPATIFSPDMTDNKRKDSDNV
ncbi:beta-2 adrenergic receptor-like [Lytechinus variegatus]|uniref:beta-2 adrenergic receptor-like n=1 Tax=Lytechinus variegatus TaxID=7654 RepID=UPI001BB21014|nr:beta-2 adrenergic receptor-like [Lytechinus variegatus]